MSSPIGFCEDKSACLYGQGQSLFQAGYFSIIDRDKNSISRTSPCRIMGMMRKGDDGG
ncbi:MAG: hypothetical protein SGI98_06025 [Verrucomicrobiota bacterium]|nr:hypothetical protein [Verrucomicrobiota bacterium]